MNKPLLTGVLSLAVSFGAASAFAQAVPPPVAPAPPVTPVAVEPGPAAPGAGGAAVAPATPPSTQPDALPPLPPPDRSGVAPTALPAVKRILDHPQSWQKGLEQVMARIENPDLRRQLTEGMNNLAPHIAQGLIDHKGDTAYATVAVYREAGGSGRQAALALAFEGFASRLDGTFYSRVLSDLPRTGDIKADGAPPDLVLDLKATWYLCFYLDQEGLGAAGIPHEQMKEELAAAFKAADRPVPVAGEQDLQDAAVKGELNQEARQNVVRQQSAGLDAQLPAGNSGPAYDSGAYAYPNNQPQYYGDWGLYGWGWYNPVYIVPGRPFQHDWHHYENWNWSGYHWSPRDHHGHGGHAGGDATAGRPPGTVTPASPPAPVPVGGTAGTAAEGTAAAGTALPGPTNAAVQPAQPGGQLAPQPAPAPVVRPAAREPVPPRQTPAAVGGSTAGPSHAGAPAGGAGGAHGGAPAGGAAGHSGGAPAGGGASHGGGGGAHK